MSKRFCAHRSNMTILGGRSSGIISKGGLGSLNIFLTVSDLFGFTDAERGRTLTPPRLSRDMKTFAIICCDLTGRSWLHSPKGRVDTKIARMLFLALAAVMLACFTPSSRPQSASNSDIFSSAVAGTTASQLNHAYVRPTQREKADNYLYDAIGPYPIVVEAFGAGIDQADYTPPEWNQGAKGYAMRFGSDFGIALHSP